MRKRRLGTTSKRRVRLPCPLSVSFSSTLSDRFEARLLHLKIGDMAAVLLLVTMQPGFHYASCVTLKPTPRIRTTALTAQVVAPLPEDHAGDQIFDEAIALCERVVNHHVSTACLDKVPALLQQVFAADYERAILRVERAVTNVTCLRPEDGANGQGLLNLDLIEFRSHHTRTGRQCHDGECGSACSRVALSGFATDAECASLQKRANALMEASTDAEIQCDGAESTIDLGACARSRDVRTTLLHLRLIERLRRAVAAEYGLQLASLESHHSFVSRIQSSAAHESYGVVHADESSDFSYHYSAVLQLGTQGADFEGGDFVFLDEEPHMQRFPPQRGRAILFSSGWENVHAIAPIDSGVRFTMPVFFGTGRWSGDDEQAGDEAEDDGGVSAAGTAALDGAAKSRRDPGELEVEALLAFWSSETSRISEEV